MEEFLHKSIMLPEAMEYLALHSGGTYLDGTLGAGGHSEAILEGTGPDGKLIGMDLDTVALEAASRRLERFGERFTAIKGNFKNAKAVLAELGIKELDGVMLDLGVSSPQLDDGERGFSYHYDAPLDMRMDREAPLSAYDVVNAYDQRQLEKVIRQYGEENFARRIAQFIVDRRKAKPIETTGELAEIITAAIPAKYRRSGPHPARRTFQALRIEVNGELENLSDTIGELIETLKPGGRICVISFHSLEDRAVKEAMKKAENPCTCPKDAPVCICGKVSLGRMVTRKPREAGLHELEENPRARSAKLRAFDRR